MLFLFLSFCVDHPFGFSIYLFIFLYFCIFFLFFCLVCLHRNVEMELHLEAPLCKVWYGSIGIGGQIKVMSIRVG